MASDLGSARPLVWSERSTLEIKTGGWRWSRPQYVEQTAPCRAACPAGEPVAAWIAEVRAGDHRRAWELIRRENPFPGVMGRVCAHPCEAACHRGAWDGAVTINALEQFVGEWGLAHGRVEPPLATRAETVAVVGGGPAGLSCAYHLARLGYRVTIYEGMPALGGLLRYGIPEYRLPRGVLNREIELILELGIEVRTGTVLGRTLPWEALGSHHAVFLATGAWVPYRLNVPGESASGVHDGLWFLGEINSGRPVALGSRVVVVGGGSTAMDVARTARRQGARSVTVVALESREAMPALREEVAQALGEGIEIRHQVGIAAVREQGGSVTGLLARSAALERDESGRVHPILFPGTDFSLDADTVFLAVGQTPDLSLLPPGLRAEGPCVAVGDDGSTRMTRIFAGGDLTPIPRSVTHAIGSGKRAAIAIDLFLRDGARERPPTPSARVPASGSRGPALTMGAYLGESFPPRVEPRPQRVVEFSEINLDYFPRARRAERRERSPEERVNSFAPVVEGLGESEARSGACRCFSCGQCVYCDNCLIFCPDMAIRRVNGGYEVMTEHCKGCGVCVYECPRGALVLESERC